MCVCVCTTHVYYSAHVEVKDNFVESDFSFYLYVGSEASNSVRQACVTSALLTEPSLWSHNNSVRWSSPIATAILWSQQHCKVLPHLE